MKKLWILLCVLVLATGMLSAGCGGSGDKQKTAAGKADKKELLVGTEPSFAPFEFPKENSKELTGFDVELIQAMAKDMGYEKCKVVGMGFDALIPALDAGNIDVAIAGMTITDARKQKVTFTKAYYQSGLIVMVNKDNADIKSIDDLKGKKIAVQMGTTGAMKAEKVPGAKVTTFDTNDLACIELKNKSVDAVIGDLPVEQYFLKNGGSAYAKLVGKPLTAEEYGIAVAKKNTDLAAKLDKSLEDLKKNGEFAKLYTKWFGKAPK